MKVYFYLFMCMVMAVAVPFLIGFMHVHADELTGYQVLTLGIMAFASVFGAAFFWQMGIEEERKSIRN